MSLAVWLTWINWGLLIICRYALKLVESYLRISANPLANVTMFVEFCDCSWLLKPKKNLVLEEEHCNQLEKYVLGNKIKGFPEFGINRLKVVLYIRQKKILLSVFWLYNPYIMYRISWLFWCIQFRAKPITKFMITSVVRILQNRKLSHKMCNETN